jgi:hypothetical protein
MDESKIKVKSTGVYIQGRQLTGEERESAGKSDAPQYHNGPPPGPDMVEHTIESPVYRRGFKPDDAEICIGVQPGDELGQIFINVQLEGAPQQYNACIQKQNDILKDASQWLTEIFGEFGADWEVDITALPCPKATDKLELEKVVLRLQNKATAERQTEATSKAEIDRRLQTNVNVERKV